MFHFSKWNGSGEDRRQGDHTLYQLSFWGVLARDTLNWEERSSLTDFMCLNTFNKQTVFIFMGGEYRGSCNYMYFFLSIFLAFHGFIESTVEEETGNRVRERGSDMQQRDPGQEPLHMRCLLYPLS